MIIANVLLGLGLLFLGRQIFWLFVGSLGFVTAVELVTRLSVPWPNWLVFVVAMVAGIIGIVLAIFLQEVAVGIAGFLAGGYVALGLLDILGAQSVALNWVFAVVLGVIGLILAVAFFDWALIVLSSLSGAALLVRGFDWNQPLTLLVFAIAAAIGIVIQAQLMYRTQRVTR